MWSGVVWCGLVRFTRRRYRRYTAVTQFKVPVTRFRETCGPVPVLRFSTSRAVVKFTLWKFEPNRLFWITESVSATHVRKRRENEQNEETIYNKPTARGVFAGPKPLSGRVADGFRRCLKDKRLGINFKSH